MARAVAQRPAGHRADVLFELVDGAAVLGPVAGIVHPRRDLVDDQPAWRHEQLHPHDADIVERVQDAAPRSAPRRCAARASAGRARWWCAGCRPRGRSRPGRSRRPRRRAPRAAITRHLVAEVDEAFEDRRGACHIAASAAAASSGGHDPRLALAVIAEPAGLQDRGRADRVQRRRRGRPCRRHRRIGRDCQGRGRARKSFRSAGPG